MLQYVGDESDNNDAKIKHIPPILEIAAEGGQSIDQSAE